MWYPMLLLLLALLLLPAIPAAAQMYPVYEVSVTDVEASWSPNPLRPRKRAYFPFFVSTDTEAGCEQARTNIETYDASAGLLASLFKTTATASPCWPGVLLHRDDFAELVDVLDDLIAENGTLRQRLRALGEDP